MSIGVLLLLGLLNWFGVSESAKVSLVGALIAFLSDIAILVTFFLHLSRSQFLALFPEMFAQQKLTLPALLAGFAGSFLAFSGLESISQLSPVMKTPRKKVAGIALLLVVLPIGLTSPLLTMFATLLLPPHFSILLAITIPICILIAVQGKITVLGDLYAFGLLGAFTLTCLGLDIVRHCERKAARAERVSSQSRTSGLPDSASAKKTLKDTTTTTEASAPYLKG